MAYYHTCPDCGANLEPGEKCDCQTNKIYITKEANTNVRNESNDHSCHRPYLQNIKFSHLYYSTFSHFFQVNRHNFSKGP